MTRYTPQWLQAGTYPAGVDRRLISAIWPGPVVSGCAVTVQSNMNLNVVPGSIVVPTANNTGSVLCSSDAVEVVTVATAPGSGTNRIDLVCCSVASTDIGTAAGDQFTFSMVAGTPAASPVAPAVPAGSVAIAQVLVIGGSATISVANITDRRPPGPGVTVPSSSPFVWQADLNGEVWVAKGGVYGGAWRKARDVLKAGVYRTAAFNATTSYTDFAFDTVYSDLFGLWTGTRFQVPVPGVYRLSATISVTPGAPGSYFSAQICINGTGVRQGGQMTNAVAGVPWLSPHVSAPYRYQAGDQASVQQIGSTAMAGVVGQPAANWADFSYEGTL